MKILLVNGPNLNLLGFREKNVYGSLNYDDMISSLKQSAEEMEIEVEFFQSNSEGGLIDKLHQAIGHFDGIIINPGAYTHYSYALHDAIKAIQIPTIEVHISNIHAREEFRKHSATAPACIGQICGLGAYGYVLAMNALKQRLENKE